MRLRLAFYSFILISFIFTACQEEKAPTPSFEELSMPSAGNIFTQSYIRELIKTVAHWQINHPIDMPEDNDWARSTFMLGMISAYKATQNDNYLEYIHAWANRNEWSMSNHSHPANDLLCGKVYLELLELNNNISGSTDPVKKEIQRMRNAMVSGREEWYWCDALFMAPPTIIHFHKLIDTQNSYSQFYNMWWDAHDYLYSPQDSLYYRDKNFFGSRTFWLRGNGWVFAGMAKILEQLPDDHTEHIKMSKIFTEIAVKFKNLQNQEGLWHPNPLNSRKHLLSETSGSALVCYALAWGINHGVLNKEDFSDCIRKAWQGLVSKIYVDGKVGWVQPRGDGPTNVYADDYHEFGAGAVLLAAYEMYLFAAHE